MKHLEGINKLILLAPLLYIIAFFAYPLTYMMLSRADPVKSVFYALTGPGFIKLPPEGALVQVLNDHGLALIVRGVDAGPLLNSLALALISSTVSTLLGTSYALLVFMFKVPRVLKAIPLLGLIPMPFIQALVVERLFNLDFGLINFILNEVFRLGVKVCVKGLAGVLLYHILTLFPIAYLIAYAFMRSIPSNLIEAAHGLGGREWYVARTVVLPLSRPAIYASLSLLFVLSLDDLSGPIVFQDDPTARNVLAYQAYMHFVEQVTGAISVRALGYVIILMAISIVAFLLALKHISAVYRSLGAGTVAYWRPKRGLSLGAASMLALLAIIAALASLPTLLGITYAFSNSWVSSPLPELGPGSAVEALTSAARVRAVLNTLAYTLASTAITFVVAFLGAYYTVRVKGGLTRVLDLLLSLPVSVPGIVLAFSYLLTFKDLLHGLPIDPLKAPWLYVVISYSVRRMPYTYKIAQAALSSIPKDFEEAAINLGARQLRVAFTIGAPLIAQALILGLWMSATYSSTEVSTSITIGSLGGAQGLGHPAPVTYLVLLDMSYSGLKYGGAAAFALLLVLLFNVGLLLALRRVTTKWGA